MMERFSSLVTKSRPWPVIGRTIFFTSDINRPTRDEIYFIDFWRENLSMYRIKRILSTPFHREVYTSCGIRRMVCLTSIRMVCLTSPKQHNVYMS